jgi:hypothetical protein
MERVHLLLEGNNSFLYIVPESDPNWTWFFDEITKDKDRMDDQNFDILFGENGKWLQYRLEYGELLNRKVEIIDTYMFY